MSNITNFAFEQPKANIPGNRNVLLILDEAREVASDKEIERAFVVLVDRGENLDCFTTSWLNAGLQTHEIIAACEIIKVEMMQLMGYIPKEEGE